MKAYFKQMLILALILFGVVSFIVGNTLLTANSYKNYIMESKNIFAQTSTDEFKAMKVIKSENLGCTTIHIDNL